MKIRFDKSFEIRVRALSEKYNFDYEESLRMFNVLLKEELRHIIEEKFNYFLAEHILKLKKEQIQSFLNNKKNLNNDSYFASLRKGKSTIYKK